jgi:thiol:disulfide interchange protein DsbD
MRALGVVAGFWAIALVCRRQRSVGTIRYAPIRNSAALRRTAEFKRIKSLTELDAAVAAARRQGKPAMLDFYADWCVSCKEMERDTFPDARVRAALANAVLLQADVTANDADDQALLRRFGIFGPPTIAFYGPDGVERLRYRVVGFMPAAEFADVAARATAR